MTNTPAKIKCVYNNRMVLPGAGKGPGLWKAAPVVDAIRAAGGFEFTERSPALSENTLCVAHNLSYVLDVLAGRVLNGHGDKDGAVLATALVQAAGFVYASELAAAIRGPVFSPTAGFHHAGYAYGGGACTFNALMIAALLHVRIHKTQALIIDGDAHFGDGCVDITNRKLPGTAGVRYISTSDHDRPEEFIESCRREISHHEGLVLYQPGADCLEMDSMGDGNYTAEQFDLRDRAVFEACKARQLAVVWNLAGGYGAPTMKETIEAHVRTCMTALEVYGLA